MRAAKNLHEKNIVVTLGAGIYHLRRNVHSKKTIGSSYVFHFFLSTVISSAFRGGHFFCGVGYVMCFNVFTSVPFLFLWFHLQFQGEIQSSSLSLHPLCVHGARRLVARHSAVWLCGAEAWISMMNFQNPLVFWQVPFNEFGTLIWPKWICKAIYDIKVTSPEKKWLGESHSDHKESRIATRDSSQGITYVTYFIVFTKVSRQLGGFFSSAPDS